MAVSRKPAIVNFVTLFLSLALIAFSVAIFSLTGHGMRKLDHAFPSGRYNWYTQHWITLRYNTANEGLMLAAAALSCVTGLISIIRPLFVQKTPTPTPTPNLTQSLLFIPSLIALFITFGALIYTSISISTNNYGECRSITGYNDYDAILACPREVAACLITHYFDDGKTWPSDLAASACTAIHRGRQLLAPLLAANLLVCGATGMQWWDGRRKV